ncbi:hypothetical protein TNCV_2035971 [Trichonephila clavipes]|nr:hypothetical protein TNCV_2035971 [Trichonephila clavipes]
MPASDPAAYERDALGSLPGKPEFRLRGKVEDGGAWSQLVRGVTVWLIPIKERDSCLLNRAGSYEWESSLLRRTVGFQAVLKEAIRSVMPLDVGPHVCYSRAHVQTGSTDCRPLTE